jgi:hypothetical protein
MEDVSFMRATAREESYIFLVDSKFRDTTAYPSPSEYSIDFAAPFRNVIGIDLLDAAVPRTEYSVETHTNTLVYVVDGTEKFASVEPGDYRLDEFAVALTASFAANGDDITVVVPTYYQITNAITFKSATTSFEFKVRDARSTMAYSLGFGNARSRIATSSLVGSEHVLKPPGLVDLTGERIAIIKCPEVEQFIYRDRASEKFHPGLGFVKMSLAMGVREANFQGYPRRTLTNPIGKLTHLSFRIETIDGRLYDSKGVDHVLLLVVRYYAAGDCVSSVPVPGRETRMLNPSYVPDVHAYLVDQKWKQELDRRDRHGRA